MSVNQRIKEIRNLKKMSQEQFGNLIGLSKSGISNIENGIRNVTERHIKLICSELKVNEEYLRTGIGDPFEKPSGTMMECMRKEFNLNDFDFNLIYSYLQLSNEKRSAIRDFFHNISINELSNQQSEHQTIHQNIPKRQNK